MLCSLSSLMWTTIWLGTPVTPIRTGMGPLPAAQGQRKHLEGFTLQSFLLLWDLSG